MRGELYVLVPYALRSHPSLYLVPMLASVARRSATPGVLGSAKRGISVQVV